jgi:hypothetical protein
MSTHDELPPGDPLRAYIEKVLELLHRGEDAPPTPVELAAVAKDLGLTTGDRERLERTAADALARGLGYLEHGRPRDAAEELETAAALRPHDVDTLHALAAARAALAIAEGHGSDDAAARVLVRRTLVLDPRHKPSFELLNRLDAAEQRRNGGGGPGNARLWAALVVAILLLVGLIAFLVLQKPAPATGLAEAPASAAAEPSETAAAEGDVPPDPNALPTEEPGNIPPQRLFAASVPPPLAVAGDGRASASLALEPGLAAKHIGVEVKSAWFERYPERSYFNAWLLLKNEGQEDITELKTEAQYLDAGGKVLKRQMQFVIISLSEALRPGDTVPVRIISEVPGETMAARMHLLHIKTRPAAPPPAAKPVDVKWTVPQPAGVHIEVYERWSEVTENPFKGGYWHKVIFEIRNTGTVPMRALTFNIMRFDAADELRQADALAVSWSHDIPLFAGETRVISSLENTPVPIKRYAVQVTVATAGLQFE